MSWSPTIATFAETKVRLHWSFLLFLLWIGLTALLDQGVGAAVSSLVFFSLLFICVVLHEFGHILAARRFGVRTPDVLLLPIGGVSRLERIPEEPRKEIIIALAGPLVSFVIGLFVLVVLGFPQVDLVNGLAGPEAILVQLGWLNIFLGAFNLIPAFPMDGGRVLRALLASRFGYARGTQLAANAGQAAAIIFGMLGLLSGNFILLLIAVFIFLAASSEAGAAQMRSATLGLTTADFMITEFDCLRLDQPVSAAAEALIRTNQRQFPIVDGKGRLCGGLDRDAIVKALHRDPQTPVSEAMQADIATVTPHHNADELVRYLQAGESMVVVCSGDDRPVGVVTWENMLEYLMVHPRKGAFAQE
ncbi:site-2 protease family protein [Aurantiacibacter gilvus]|uniref:Zinc metalloprotease n=1 Tax=Aurantiacibacter gilvus TaxID=3139141 RepID=A0ABU9IEZ7_9SPHN